MRHENGRVYALVTGSDKASSSPLHDHYHSSTSSRPNGESRCRMKLTMLIDGSGGIGKRSRCGKALVPDFVLLGYWVSDDLFLHLRKATSPHRSLREGLFFSSTSRSATCYNITSAEGDLQLGQTFSDCDDRKYLWTATSVHSGFIPRCPISGLQKLDRPDNAQ